VKEISSIKRNELEKSIEIGDSHWRYMKGFPKEKKK